MKTAGQETRLSNYKLFKFHVIGMCHSYLNLLYADVKKGSGGIAISVMYCTW